MHLPYIQSRVLLQALVQLLLVIALHSRQETSQAGDVSNVSRISDSSQPKQILSGLPPASSRTRALRCMTLLTAVTLEPPAIWRMP
jgi:hypothetical protein